MDTYSEAYRHQCEVRTCIKMSVEYGRQVLREHFVNIFNGTVAQRVEPPVMESGGGFKSFPVPT